jgi:serine phosphatase RsbU (regulator of sigma subunit)
MSDPEGTAGPGTSGESLHHRVVRIAVQLSLPNPEIVDPELRRRARLLVTLALNLAVLLSFSAVLSTITTGIDPSSPYTLGWGGTAIVYLAAIGFWISWALSRSVRPLLGAWASIFTIYVFLTGFSVVFFDAADSLMVALAMPVLAGTVFLDVRGTLRLAVFSMILGLAYYPLISEDPLSWIYGYAILIAVLGLTLFLSLMREDDLAQLQRLSELERRDADRLRNEAELARTVQLAMLPTHLPEAVGVELAAYSVPAKEASGDFYDVFLVDHGSDPKLGSLVVVVCDVAGKGMASALVVSAARTALRSESERDPTPSRVLERVNRLLHASIPDRLFLTMFFGVLDLGTGELRFASGGHPHPHHWDHDAKVLHDLVSDGLPLGLVEDADYVERSVVLEPGDFVIAYTDGLVEALNAERELYGFERVRIDAQACVGRADTVQGRIEFLVDAMERFVEGVPPEDDVTLVAFAIPPRGTDIDLRDIPEEATAPAATEDLRA